MIPIPLRDENPRYGTPLVTGLLIAINLVAWGYELLHGVTLSTFDYGLIPSWLLAGMRDGALDVPRLGHILLHQEVPQPLSVFSSMFMHGSWGHLIGNLWFLWVFGDNVEDALGHLRFAVFYLVCGVAAALAQVLSVPASTAPMVGASGAIAGVMGAYLLLYPRARIRCLWVLIIFITTISVPAWLLLGIWFVSQLALPLDSGVAWMAHVGGFVAGLLLVRLFTLGRTRLWYTGP